MNPAIIVAAYNRPKSLTRILTSISKGIYVNYSDIPLIISIDGGGPDEVINIAKDFNWQYGIKRIIQHPVNIGLRNHIIACGDLTEQYGNVIMLEDDIYVSPNFYDYAKQALDFYSNDEKISGISLYSNKQNSFAQLPFQPLKDGNDVYFMQIPSSLGQAWTKQHWNGFTQFYNSKPILLETDKIPEEVKKWPESSWKKYFIKYMVDRDLYFVYPHINYTTCFGDKGTHFYEQTSTFQLSLGNSLLSHQKVKFIPFNQGNVKYDSYYELLPECFKIYGVKQDADFGIDIYGMKSLELFDHKYFFSIKDCRNAIEGFDAVMQPIENNILIGVRGNIINFAQKEDFDKEVSIQKKTFIASVFDTSVFEYGFLAGRNSYKKEVMSKVLHKIAYALGNPKALFYNVNRRFRRFYLWK